MGKKFILVFEEVEEFPENHGNPGFYITRQGNFSFLKFIPIDVGQRPSCIEIKSKELDFFIEQGLKEGEKIENINPGNSEPKEHIRQQSNIDIPVMEWVSAETLVKLVELITKK